MPSDMATTYPICGQSLLSRTLPNIATNRPGTAITSCHKHSRLHYRHRYYGPRTVSTSRQSVLSALRPYYRAPETHSDPERFLDKLLSGGVFIAECGGKQLSRQDTAKVAHILARQIFSLVVRPYPSRVSWLRDNEQFERYLRRTPARSDSVETDVNAYEPLETPTRSSECSILSFSGSPQSGEYYKEHPSLDEFCEGYVHRCKKRACQCSSCTLLGDIDWSCSRTTQETPELPLSPSSDEKESEIISAPPLYITKPGFDSVPLSIESLVKIWSGQTDSFVAREVSHTNVYGFYTIVCSIQVYEDNGNRRYIYHLYSDSQEKRFHALSYTPFMRERMNSPETNDRYRLVQGEGSELSDIEWARNIAELDEYFGLEDWSGKRTTIEVDGKKIVYYSTYYEPASPPSSHSDSVDISGFSCHAALTKASPSEPFYTRGECTILLLSCGAVLLLCHKSGQYACAKNLRDVVSDVSYEIPKSIERFEGRAYNLTESQLGDLVLGGRKSALQHMKAKFNAPKIFDQNSHERGIVKLSELFIERYTNHLVASSSANDTQAGEIEIETMEQEFDWITYHQCSDEARTLVAEAKKAVLNKWTSNGNTGMDFWDVYNMVLDTFIVRNRGPNIGIPVRIGGVPYLAQLSDEGKIEKVGTLTSRVTGIAGEAASTAVRTFANIELRNVIKILGLVADFPDADIVDATLLRILGGRGVNFQDGGNCLCHAFSTTTGPTISRQPTLTDCFRLGMKLVRTDGNGLALAFARSKCHELWTYDDSYLTLKTFHDNVSTKCQSMDGNILGKQVASLSEEEKLCRLFVHKMERKVESGVHVNMEHVGYTAARFGAHSDVQHIVESIAARRTMVPGGAEEVNWIERLIGMANEIVESVGFREIADNDRRLTFGKITVG